jgi:hypothetical protein
MTESRQPQDNAHDGDGAAAPSTSAFEELDRRPVAEHVAIFEAEHARLQDELSTIDQL